MLSLFFLALYVQNVRQKYVQKLLFFVLFCQNTECTERYFKPLLSNSTHFSNIGVIKFTKRKTLWSLGIESTFIFFKFNAKSDFFYVICV